MKPAIRYSSVLTSLARKKRRLSSAQAKDDLRIDTLVDGDGFEFLSGNISFTQVHFMPENWLRTDTRTGMITLTILIPYGTSSFRTRVVDYGDYVELMVDWAGPMMDIKWMLRKWHVLQKENDREKFLR